ncbi:hypothetical protein Tco_0492192 [Tanacetum coccineum]
MLYYLTGMEPYYIQCIKDGLFQPKTDQENFDDEADERTIEEYLRDLEIEFHEIALLSKNKGLVVETFDWDEEDVYDDEDMTQVTVLMALTDDELAIWKNHARNAKLDVVTFQIQNTKLIKINHALQEQLKKERKLNEKWLNISNKVSQCISEQIPNQKKKILGIDQLTEVSSKSDVKENPFIPASMDYDHERSQNLKTGLKDSILTPITSSVPTEVKNNEQDSKINDLTKLVRRLIDEKDTIMSFGNGYQQKDKNEAKTNKTKHGNEKSMKSQSQVNQSKSQSQQVKDQS